MRRPTCEDHRNMEDVEETLEEELDEAEEPGEDLEGDGSPAPAAAGEEGVESIQDLLVKQEARADEEDEVEDSVLNLTREELRDESLAVKVVPPQPNEFTCRKCYLVKHRSQLKDRTKMLCRDCA
jgi:hypothetical protein